MSTLNDAIMEATGGPTANEGQLAWFQTHGAAGITDYAQAERKFLEVATATAPGGTLTNADLWRKFLIAGGYITPDMTTNTGMLAYWLNQGGAPPQSWAYDLTVGTYNGGYGFWAALAGSLTPTGWPDGSAYTISHIGTTNTNYFTVNGSGGVRVPGCYSLAIQLQGWTGGYGVNSDVFTCYWSPNDYLQMPDVALATFMQSKLGLQVGFNAMSCNNFIFVGNNGTYWGWSNGLGFGSLADTGNGSGDYAWPFGGVIVNYYVDAADLLTIQFNLGTGLQTVTTVIPGINGTQPIVLSGNGQTFTATVPGLAALLQAKNGTGVAMSVYQ